jgi:hypothetical protein
MKPAPQMIDVHRRYGCRRRGGEKTNANVRALMARVDRIRWVRFAFAFRKAWVCAAEGAVGRKRREGSVRVDRVYETPWEFVSIAPSRTGNGMEIGLG